MKLIFHVDKDYEELTRKIFRITHRMLTSGDEHGGAPCDICKQDANNCDCLHDLLIDIVYDQLDTCIREEQW